MAADAVAPFPTLTEPGTNKKRGGELTFAKDVANAWVR